jgi:NAD(P)-dependent dehydrogenase (short-subunit alcohol dehydrogenase family)
MTLMAAPALDIFSLEGRVALVTGASSGIGRRMALAFAGVGADVVLVARRRGVLEVAAREIEEATGRHVHCIDVDLAKLTDFEALAALASKPFGAPDILVNAAGVNYREPWDALTRDRWDTTLAVNLTAPFFLARALVPGMRQKSQGNIINIASLQSFRAFPDSAPYGASKGGVVQLTRAMAEAWSRYGIVSNAIAPGMFPTDLTAPVFGNPELAARFAALTAIGRNGELRDLDGTAIFLASRASAYVTGQVIAVDGGVLAK